MRVVIRADPKEVADYAYDFVRRKLEGCKGFVLGLAAGVTPLGLYRKMVEGYNWGELDFSNVHTFNLDEYVGLEPNHAQSYFCFMRSNLFDLVNLKEENIHFFSGVPETIEGHCDEHERQIRKAGGIELQILGIGRNGHIGFNEPTSSLGSRTRMVTLTQDTMSDNQRHFPTKEDVPRYALTMGVATILETKEILLLATGSGKAGALAAMIEGPVTSICPASALQMHPRVAVVCDEAAAQRLAYTEHYERVIDNARSVDR